MGLLNLFQFIEDRVTKEPERNPDFLDSEGIVNPGELPFLGGSRRGRELNRSVLLDRAKRAPDRAISRTGQTGSASNIALLKFRKEDRDDQKKALALGRIFLQQQGANLTQFSNDEIIDASFNPAAEELALRGLSARAGSREQLALLGQDVEGKVVAEFNSAFGATKAEIADQVHAEKIRKDTQQAALLAANTAVQRSFDEAINIEGTLDQEKRLAAAELTAVQGTASRAFNVFPGTFNPGAGGLLPGQQVQQPVQNIRTEEVTPVTENVGRFIGTGINQQILESLKATPTGVRIGSDNIDAVINGLAVESGAIAASAGRFTGEPTLQPGLQGGGVRQVVNSALLAPIPESAVGSTLAPIPQSTPAQAPLSLLDPTALQRPLSSQAVEKDTEGNVVKTRSFIRTSDAIWLFNSENSQFEIFKRIKN